MEKKGNNGDPNPGRHRWGPTPLKRSIDHPAAVLRRSAAGDFVSHPNPYPHGG